MADTPEEDENVSIDDTNAGNVTPDAEVKTTNSTSEAEAESPDNPNRSRLKQIIFTLKNRRKVQVLAGIIVLILIIIGIILYKLQNYLWQAKQRRIAEKKCKEYTKFACDHPLPSNSSQIVLGEIASFGMYPHMVFLELLEGTNFPDVVSGYRTCGGTLLSENFVLTGAHCVDGLQKIVGLATLGAVNISKKNANAERIAVRNTYKHPLYIDTPDTYDFLLIELDRKVEFTPYLRPICLSTVYLDKYDRIIATGWGRTEDGNASDVLKTVDLATDGLVAETCNKKVPPLLGNKTIDVICAGWPNSSRGIRKGDSGGPLQVISDSRCANTYVQIGVTSLVLDRPNRTYTDEILLSLYVIVANVAPWIASIVWPNESA